MEEPAHHDVVQHVEPAGEIELLEDHGAARPPLAERPALERGDVGVAEQDAAAAGIAQAVDHAQQGRLAGAGAADHADQLAGRNDQRHLVDGALVAKTLGDAFQSQHWTTLAKLPSSLGSGGRLHEGDGSVTEIRQGPRQTSGRWIRFYSVRPPFTWMVWPVT